MSSFDDQDQTAEVVEDYENALEALTMNSRYEIVNLTSIARDFTNYAYNISETLQSHIKKSPPQRKLPALYVLDSIVKNIGTPYTLFFSKNLYSTFMEAYAAVDPATRRKMEEMLKTWKEPVPGSIDRSPVFDLEVVRPIENALIKARTSALQAQQEQMRAQQQLLGRAGRPALQQYRQTPTPPGGRPGHLVGGPYQPPYLGVNGNPHPDANHGQQQQAYLLNAASAYANSTPQRPPSAVAAAPYQPPPAHELYNTTPQPGLSIDSLNDDIQQLIVASRADIARNPLNTSVQTRLKALMDLQALLQSQNLPQDQLVLVKNQVAELTVKFRASNNAGPAQTTYTPTPPTAALPYQPPPAQQAQQPPVAAPVAPVPLPSAAAPPASVSIDSLFGQGALAALLSRQPSATPQAPTPQPPPAPNPTPVPAAIIRSPVPQQQAAPQKPATPDPMALLGALRSVGILLATQPVPGVSATTAAAAAAQPAPRPPPPVVTNPTPAALPAAAAAPPISIPPNIADILASARVLASTPKLTVPVPLPLPLPPDPTSADLTLKTASLKQYRPHLLPSLYEALGPPCTQCGRRFRTDEEGKRKKTGHMDFHFRVHQRVAEAEKRGQHRSWYVDQADWIKSRETIDLDPAAAAAAEEEAAKAAEPARGAPKTQWIPVPDDGTNAVCPICQEKFETKWLDEAQEWVWTDAVRVGSRAYHASCYAEASGGGGGGIGGGGLGAVGGDAGNGTPLYSRSTPEPTVLGKRKAEAGGDEVKRVKA